MSALQDLMLLSYVKSQWCPYMEASSMSDTYYDVLRRFSEHPRRSYRALIDGKLLIAGAVVYRTVGYLWVSLLISAPYRVKGAGTKMLIRCAKEAQNYCQGQIRLGSTPSALSFYQERGFQVVSRPPEEHPEWDTQMHLSKSNLLAFLERYS